MTTQDPCRVTKVNFFERDGGGTTAEHRPDAAVVDQADLAMAARILFDAAIAEARGNDVTVPAWVADEVRAECDRRGAAEQELSVLLRGMARRLADTRRKAIAGISVNGRRWEAIYRQSAAERRQALAELEVFRSQVAAALALLHPIESFCGWHEIEEVRRALGETEEQVAAEVELERHGRRDNLGVTE